MQFSFSKQKYDLAQLNSLESLDTNGLGGYFSFTILGGNTRKYHWIVS